jgi:peptidoglycan/LPS O-acetylase OafA/YrhL
VCHLYIFSQFGVATTLKNFGIFAVFYVFAIGRLTWIVIPPLTFLGTISYSLYLVHCEAGYTFIHWLHVGHGLPPGLAMIVSAIAAVSIATLFCFGIERPANRALTRWLRKPAKAQ